MSLMLLVVSSLLFALLEASRYAALGMMAQLTSQSVTESMFAEYHIPAYRDYHLLLLDSGYGTGDLKLSEINARMQRLGQENLNPQAFVLGRSYNLLRMSVTDSSVLRYELATDSDMAPLTGQMAEVAKSELASDVLEGLMQNGADAQDSISQGRLTDGYIDDAMEALEQGSQETGAVSQSAGLRLRSISQPAQEKDGGESDETPRIDNPMEDVQSAKKSPLLSQIFGEEVSISGKKLADTDGLVTRRVLNAGNYDQSAGGGVAKKVLIARYLKKYTSHYLNPLSNIPHALDYEQEYILFGKNSDRDNLKKMAGRLLLVREGVNFLYLQTDVVKQEEALAMATALAAAMAVPAAAPAIQQGLLASWAYAESIVEIRTLYDGGRIAALKTGESWTLGLSEVAGALFDTSRKAKSVSGGQDYEDYLQTFLLLESQEKLAGRFANLLERNLCLNPGYEQGKLDCMVTSMETSSVYQANQMFLSFVSIVRPRSDGYEFRRNEKFSYLRTEK